MGKTKADHSKTFQRNDLLYNKDVGVAIATEGGRQVEASPVRRADVLLTCTMAMSATWPNNTIHRDTSLATHLTP